MAARGAEADGLRGVALAASAYLSAEGAWSSARPRYRREVMEAGSPDSGRLFAASNDRERELARAITRLGEATPYYKAGRDAAEPFGPPDTGR